MPASLEYLERCSAQTGYQVVALEKVTRLGEIAGEIGRHPSLRDALALKGGTAINLCPGGRSRALRRMGVRGAGVGHPCTADSMSRASPLRSRI
jgi:hypothetical protein